MLNTTINFKGIKKAITDYNNAQSCGLSTIFYFDMADITVWCDVFVSRNDWKVYHSDTIHRVDFSTTEYNGKITMAVLNEAIINTIDYYDLVA